MVGKNMAFAVFNKHPGLWRVRQIAGSEAATKFWRRVIGEYTNGNYTETHIENPPWGLSICQIFNNQISQLHKIMKKEIVISVPPPIFATQNCV